MNRLRNQIRIAITLFVLALLVIVMLAWTWTTAHQPAALSAASHMVLGISALAGLFAIATIWRRA